MPKVDSPITNLFERYAPTLLLVVAGVIHVFTWRPPPEIRWDGTLHEWPIPWMVCFDEFTTPLVILAIYASSWVIASVSCFHLGFRKSIPSLGALLAAPVAVYVLMYAWYFGFRS